MHDPDGPPVLPMRESAGGEFIPSAAPPKPVPVRPAGPRGPRRSRLTPTPIGEPKLRVPDIEEPEFLKRGRHLEQTGRTRRILLVTGSVVLLLALAAQVVSTFRNVLAAQFPDAKPALAGACTVLGCRIELPAQIDALAIETGELLTLDDSAFSFTTLLRNQSSLVQAWPHIELELTDTNDKPLLRRVFTPVDYLPKDTASGAGFAAHSEQPIKLYFRLDEIKPSGYHIAVFYP
jgi:hypothetical protein